MSKKKIIALVLVIIGLALLLGAVFFWIDTLTSTEPAKLSESIRDWATLLFGLGASLKGWMDLFKKEEKSQPIHRAIAMDKAQAVAGESARAVRTDGGNYYEHYHAAPAESTPVSPIHQLPAPPADFTGREKELKELCDKIRSGGVTISGIRGMGGIGKTALALELAEQLTSQYPDAQIFLDLRGTDRSPLTPAQAMAHVITSLEPVVKLPEDEQQLAGLYRTILSGKKALLLWDNARDAKQVEPLLVQGCLILVTSRQHFALPGLAALDLETLAPQDARKLIRKIVRRLKTEEADEIARLCGCLPLAMRLAASALAERKDLTAQAYLERLKDARTRLGLVEASLSLSYNLLEEDLKLRFRQSGVFPAPFTKEAAAAIWQVEDEFADKTLDLLLNHSLLEFDRKSGRYSLHDLVHTFAISCFSGTELGQAMLGYARYYADILEQANQILLTGKENVLAGLRLFDDEWSHISTGQKWSAEHCEENKEAAEMCSRYGGQGSILDLRLHPRENIRWKEGALKSARILGNKEAEGTHLGNLGSAYAALGEARQAIEFHEKALAIDREIGDRRGEGNSLGNLGNAYAALGEVRKAIEFYEKALAIDREIGDRRGEGAALGNLGSAYAALGETRQAIEFHEKALAIDREIGDRRGEGADLGNLGSAYAALGEARKAIEFYEKQLVIVREIGDRRGEGAALGNLGSAYAALGETRQAIEFHEKALAIDREIGDRRGEGADLGNLGIAYKNLGETRQAIEYHEKALVVVQEIGDKRAEGSILGNLGSAYADLGETRQAIEFHEKALAIDREIGDRRGEGADLGNLGNSLYELGEKEQGIALVRQALAIFEAIESPNAEWARGKLKEWGVK